MAAFKNIFLFLFILKKWALYKHIYFDFFLLIKNIILDIINLPQMKTITL